MQQQLMLVMNIGQEELISMVKFRVDQVLISGKFYIQPLPNPQPELHLMDTIPTELRGIIFQAELE